MEKIDEKAADQSSSPHVNRASKLKKARKAFIIGVFAFIGGTAVLVTYAAQSNFSVPASIASNCSADVTDPLQSWINTIPDNSTLVFPNNGCYRIDRTLYLDHRNGLTIEGNNTDFRTGTDGAELCPSTRPDCGAKRGRGQFSILYSNNIVMRNTIVHGANPQGGKDGIYDPTREAQHAYTIGAGSDGVTLDHVQAYDVYGDFVFMAGFPSNVTVKNSAFARNGRQGWSVDCGTNILFDHNSITDTRRATIDMEPNASECPVNNVTFSNNDIGPGRAGLFSNGGAPNHIDGVNFLYNHMHNKPFTFWGGSDGRTGYNYKVIGNVVDGPIDQAAVDQSGWGAIQFSAIIGVEVRDNVLSMTPGRDIACVGIARSQNIIVTGNHCWGAPRSINYWVGVNDNKNICYSGNYVDTDLHLEQSLAPCGPLNASIFAPTNGATINGKYLVQASGLNGTQPYTHVQYFANGNMIGDVQAGGFGAPLQWDTTKLPKGKYVLTAKLFDSNNQSATSPPITVTVDNSQPPTPTPIQNDGGGGGQQTTGNPPTIIQLPSNSFGLGSAIYGASGHYNLSLPSNLLHPGDKVQYFVDGHQLNSSNLDTSSLSNGDHNVTVVVTDKNGNKTTYGSKVSVRNRNIVMRTIDNITGWGNHFFDFLYRSFYLRPVNYLSRKYYPSN